MILRHSQCLRRAGLSWLQKVASWDAPRDKASAQQFRHPARWLIRKFKCSSMQNTAVACRIDARASFMDRPLADEQTTPRLSDCWRIAIHPTLGRRRLQAASRTCITNTTSCARVSRAQIVVSKDLRRRQQTSRAKNGHPAGRRTR